MLAIWRVGDDSERAGRARQQIEPRLFQFSGVAPRAAEREIVFALCVSMLCPVSVAVCVLFLDCAEIDHIISENKKLRHAPHVAREAASCAGGDASRWRSALDRER